MYYPLSEKHGFVPQTSYLEFLKEDVDLLFLCSPDNPSGAVIPKDFLLEILKTCEEKRDSHEFLDECFVEFLSRTAKNRHSAENAREVKKSDDSAGLYKDFCDSGNPARIRDHIQFGAA